MTNRQIESAAWPKPAAGAGIIVAPFYLFQVETAGEQSSLEVDNSSAVFTFPAVAAGQVLQGTLSCSTAPDYRGNSDSPPDTAVFTAATNSNPFAKFSGRNTRGPIQLVSNNQLVVQATGLIPGVTYVMAFQGTSITNGAPVDVWPAPYAESVTDSTEQIFLFGPKAVLIDETEVITTEKLWRSLWVVTYSGVVPTVEGVQSGLTYASSAPPYLSPVNTAKFYRFPIIYGLDTQVIIEWGANDTVWWGADLADVDSTVFNVNGGGLLTVTSYGSDNFVVMGPIVVPTDDTNTIPPFFAHIGTGQTVTYTAIYAATLEGEVTGDFQQNGVTIPGLSGVTITSTPTAFNPTSPVNVNDRDAFSFVPASIADTPAGLTLSFEKTIVT